MTNAVGFTGIAANSLLNIWSLVTLTVIGHLLDKSPRNMFERYVTLTGLGWGTLYPKFANLAIIAICYSIISPLVLGFATIGFGCVYLATRYNAFYVLTNNIDTQGAAYAKALQHLMIGIYLAEICLIGLFVMNTAPGPIAMMGVFFVLTVVYHITMYQALGQLTSYLPKSLNDQDQLAMFTAVDTRSYDYSIAGIPPTDVAPVPLTGFNAKKAALFSSIFSPKKVRSSLTPPKTSKR